MPKKNHQGAQKLANFIKSFGIGVVYGIRFSVVPMMVYDLVKAKKKNKHK